ncbi:hypothetical protein NM208_g9415 [Fusarium decemcellulare]|uniref:Uncharacterized protein n=1 Tax=Fusarium decemcellulare TaxID=57161 RepID=A0ACC1S1N4_9HYPO|nr:hypothetical protein NM208_g9415 [Fusarium decemcellulare]
MEVNLTPMAMDDDESGAYVVSEGSRPRSKYTGAYKPEDSRNPLGLQIREAELRHLALFSMHSSAWSQSCHASRHEALGRKKDLINRFENSQLQGVSDDPESTARLTKMLSDIENWQDKTQRYLDEALRDDVDTLFRGWPEHNGVSKPLDYLEHVLVQVEPVIYRRFMAAMDKSIIGMFPSELGNEADLATAAEVLYSDLWRYCSKLNGVDVDKAAAEFIQNCYEPESSQTPRDIKALGDAYMLKLRDSFVNLKCQGAERSATINFLKTSRHERHLKLEYMR